jgi:hypothetical protein
MCYSIIKNNPIKTVLYFDTENSKYDLLDKLSEYIHIGYMVMNRINDIYYIIKTYIKDIDYFIIDSITASDVEKNGVKLQELFDLIKNNNSNLIIVSQEREYKFGKFYENKKNIDIECYQIEIKNINDKIIANDKYEIETMHSSVKLH